MFLSDGTSWPQNSQEVEITSVLYRGPEAWLVDLAAEVLEVYREPARDGYRSLQRLRRGDRVAPLAFPDFEIPVESVLP